VGTGDLKGLKQRSKGGKDEKKSEEAVFASSLPIGCL
jgi:hypothetical protein